MSAGSWKIDSFSDHDIGLPEIPYILQNICKVYGIFMSTIQYFVMTFREYLWSFPMLFLLFGTHLYFTVRTGFIQRRLPEGIALSVAGAGRGQEREGNHVSPYSALATALAATIGTGNIVGISTAIIIGGPGAVFWCWLTGLFGVATCYAECFLSVKYRQKNPDGSTCGGPMYILERRLGKRGLAVAFALFAALASLGVGSSVQAYSIRMAVEQQIAVSPQVIGIVTGVLAGLVIVGGSGQIAKVCTWLVPVMSVLYLGGCLYLIGANRAVLPETISVIVTSAFSSQAVLGGVAGQTVMVGIRTGISRGLFTNEAGLGSIPMAAATAETTDPVRQGLISMTGPFWDTVVLCAVTGITFVSSMLSHPGSYIGVSPEEMCFVAFGELPFGGSMLLSVSLALFAFATIIGWNVYGTSAVRYLFGEAGIRGYQVLYMLFAYLGAVMSMELVWGISDLLNSFMAIPNLLCLWMLQKEVFRSLKH